MKIKKIKLTNFRCFEDFQIEFSDEYNIHTIIAENMVGKSALMAAIKLAANTYTSGLKIESQINIKDHRVVGNNPIHDITADVFIETTALILDNQNHPVESSWFKYKTKPIGERTKIEINEGLDPRKQSKITYKLASEGNAILPLFGYIGTEYIHVESSDTVAWEINGNSIDGYKGCFEDKSIKKFLFKWIQKVDSLISEMNRKPIMAESYKEIPKNAITIFQKAVTSLLPDIEIIEWSNDAKQPLLKFNNGEIRLFDMVSDGYRYLILLAGELATRAFILNKHEGVDILEKIHGVVIIDEFGTHLHPALQNDTLIRLGITFPNIQFIISTHSPLLLNGLYKEQIHILSINKEGERIVSHPEQDIIGLGANDIITEVFGLPTTMDYKFLQLENEYRILYIKKTKGDLDPKEIERFSYLSKKLSELRLDPELEVSDDDTITKIVKQKLKEIEDHANFKIDTNDIENKINNIIDDFFKK